MSNVELAGCAFVEHAVAADDECDDARRVAATDSVAQLARQRGLARSLKILLPLSVRAGERAVRLSGRAPKKPAIR